MNKKKRVIFEWVLVITAAAAALSYVLLTAPSVELRVQAPQQAEITMSAGEGRALQRTFTLQAADRVQTFGFPLPQETAAGGPLCLHPGTTPTVIHTVSLRCLFTVITWKAREIRALFPHHHGIKTFRVKKRLLHIAAGTPGGRIEAGEKFREALEDITQQRPYYIILVLLAVPALYFIARNFSIEGLRVFGSPPALVRMGLLFLVLVSFPLLNGIFNLVPSSGVTEKRRLAPPPVFRPASPWDYSRQFTGFFKDHFSLRGHFIYLGSWLKYRLFSTPAVPKVLVGREGWLFLDRLNQQPGTVEYFRSTSLFTEVQLEQWARLLRQRYRWLAERGIDYVFMIVPNKNTIYPEYMPPRIRKAHRESRMDQLLAYLRQHAPEVAVPDLRPALMEAKKKHPQYPLYPRTDSHWNDYGAYTGYRELMRYISGRFESFRGAAPIPLERFKITTQNRLGCDLAEMLSLQHGVMRENMLHLTPEPPFTAVTGALPPLSRLVRRGFSQCPAAKLPNMVMIHDSCFTRLRPFLAESFSRVCYVWDWGRGFFPRVFDEEKPKLVLDQMAERFLMDRFPINEKIEKQ